MKPLLCRLLTLTFLGCVVQAAPVMQHPSDPSVYFYYVFMSLTNPDRPVYEASAFEDAYAAMHHLNSADITTLRARAEEFRVALTEARAQSLAVALGDEDGHATHALNVAFRRQVSDIGNRFLGELSPEAAARVRSVMGPATPPTAEPANASVPRTPLPNTKPPRASYTCPGGGSSITYPNCVPSSFTTCIATSGTASAFNICTLAAGTYYVDGSANYPTLVVGGHYVMVEGAAGNTTTIERCSQASSCATAGTSYPQDIAEVGPSQYQVYFIGLTFNGNAATMGYKYKKPGEYHPGYYFEVDLQQTGVSDTWVQNCIFNNSPQFSISTNYYSYISGNQFNFYDDTTENGDGAIRTYTAQGADQSIGIQVTTNTVQNSGGGATGIQGATDLLIQGNTIYNSNYGCQFGVAGGAIGVVPNPTTPAINPSYVSVISNNIYGPPMGVKGYINAPSCSYGTELWGSEYTINSNTIEWQGNDGLFMWNMSNSTVDKVVYGAVYDNVITNNGADGVDIRDASTSGGCPPASSMLLTLTYNTIEDNNSYSIEGVKDGCMVANTYPNANNVTAGSTNTISGNGNAALICPTGGSSQNNQPCYH
jgi:hypothetical protein